MLRIVDRRFDSRNRSSINRSRFIRRFKAQIRKAVADAVSKRGVRDLENGERIGISGRDIAEPQFANGRGGVGCRARHLPNVSIGRVQSAPQTSGNEPSTPSIGRL